ncbi:mannosyltransferase [Dendrothele bispora CBS 962.96]|uniref:GDP-Man:Man(3)GlcNAc(2)-PP-Dol alpha-1,2-mannosyltransferase n=1 Tax=Dendrothele bispora (strain CBS 962.96) TaxID=1314807 RepID=A0A4S8MTA4_DENBC|nr:mannosyltransferase [Dendrothele bispora CBS 962.96]
MSVLGILIPVSFVLLSVCAALLDRRKSAQRSRVLASLGLSKPKDSSGKLKFVGFFHPYCNAGGGGERVLWAAVAHMQRNDPDVISVVYTGDTDATKEEIISKAKSRFDVTLHPGTLHFVFLDSRKLVEDKAWPHFTLLGQSLGSMVLGWEAMTKFIPDLFIDTMGYAFTFPVVALLSLFTIGSIQVPIGAYVHYPIIHGDMIARVKGRKQWHTNTNRIANSEMLSFGKILYYRFLLYYYSLSLRQASFIMVNSSWTQNHANAILNHSDKTLDWLHHLMPILGLLKLFLGYTWFSHRTRTKEVNAAGQREARIVYPPVEPKEMVKFSLEDREKVILSLAQFRPEKDHPTQLRAFAELLKTHPETGNNAVKLVLIGGCRNAEDEARVEALKKLARELDIENKVEFILNAPYSDMLRWLSRASIGLSTMIDEHFGINVVEFMAAGLIPVAHESGGPLKDIIVPYNGERTGFHATTPTSFAQALHNALSLSKEEDKAIRERARTSAVQRFSEEEFVRGWELSGWRKWL